MNMEPSRFYSHGKLLLSAEYLILDGATGLALPTKQGQLLEVAPNSHGEYRFISAEADGTPWFRAHISPSGIEQLSSKASFNPAEAVISTTDAGVAATLVQMLVSISRQRQTGVESNTGFDFHSRLEFPRNWGLGSSSTFINNLAQWSKTDPYRILKDSLGGSGYDIACAASNTPLFYNLNGKQPTSTPTTFDPPFRDQLYFVHLNKKQNSREGIARYRALEARPEAEIARATEISRALATCDSPEVFGALLEEHENLIAKLLGLRTVKADLFPDFPGQLKSLGAWGGDFIMALTQEDPSDYFAKKGYPTVLPYQAMIL